MIKKNEKMSKQIAKWLNEIKMHEKIELTWRSLVMMEEGEESDEIFEEAVIKVEVARFIAIFKQFLFQWKWWNWNN